MKLIIASNRLPLTVKFNDGEMSFEPSAGGLASGISSLLESKHNSSSALAKFADHLWIGWPGTTVPADRQDEVVAKTAERHGVPVFLSDQEMENFYMGFCNKTIWPLFHYFPSYAAYDRGFWDVYAAVNASFCQAIKDVAEPGDVIWIHDYHLMLLPELVRQAIPDVQIGFFLHIPFPSFEVFRLLPQQWRESILNGLMGADLVGFHTHDYVQSFMRCIIRILGVEHAIGKVFLRDRTVRVDSFPMGIDFAKFNKGVKEPEAILERGKMRESFGDRRVIFSLDRLDYSKGLLHRLRAFELFLERYPEWHGKVMLLLVVIPSRVGVERYDEMKKSVDESVGKINGMFAAIGWTPISYQFRSIPFHTLVALYSESDVMLVTPLRDGMNLVAKEYLSARTNDSGVLILSEMAGAAQELGESIIINPNDIEQVAQALNDGLQLSAEEQSKRNRSMRKRLMRYDVTRWTDEFLGALDSQRLENESLKARVLNAAVSKAMIKQYQAASSRLLLLDYDGTLVPYTLDPERAYPDKELTDLLQRLSGDGSNTVVIISGRSSNLLEQWFGRFGLVLMSEHGAQIRSKDGQWSPTGHLSSEWKERLLPILESAADRLPGAFVEDKQSCLALHYRRSDLELASVRVKELTDNLVHLTATMDVQVIHGHRVLELRGRGVDKGRATERLLTDNSYDFVLALGDDRTDEDTFNVLPQSAYTIKVGLGQSVARYHLGKVQDVRRLLGRLIEDER